MPNEILCYMYSIVSLTSEFYMQLGIYYHTYLNYYSDTRYNIGLISNLTLKKKSLTQFLAS